MLNFINKRIRTAGVVAVATKINTLVNMWIENIGSLQLTRCNEVWSRIKDEVNKVGLIGIVGIAEICYSVKKIKNPNEA